MSHYDYEGESWDVLYYGIPYQGDHYINGRGEVVAFHPDYYVEDIRLLVTRTQVKAIKEAIK